MRCRGAGEVSSALVRLEDLRLVAGTVDDTQDFDATLDGMG